jgi:hypothetical protein
LRHEESASKQQRAASAALKRLLLVCHRVADRGKPIRSVLAEVQALLD